MSIHQRAQASRAFSRAQLVVAQRRLRGQVPSDVQQGRFHFPGRVARQVGQQRDQRRDRLGVARLRQRQARPQTDRGLRVVQQLSQPLNVRRNHPARAQRGDRVGPTDAAFIFERFSSAGAGWPLSYARPASAVFISSATVSFSTCGKYANKASVAPAGRRAAKRRTAADVRVALSSSIARKTRREMAALSGESISRTALRNIGMAGEPMDTNSADAFCRVAASDEARASISLFSFSSVASPLARAEESHQTGAVRTQMRGLETQLIGEDRLGIVGAGVGGKIRQTDDRQQRH